MTPQELKASVLQYALQGKLVGHDPNEGTGQAEVSKMQQHKERLQKVKEIKKEKALPPITDSEILYDIPDNWCWERVGNIGSWSSGATPSRTNPEYYGGNIPWLKTGDLNDGFVSTVPEFITEMALEKTSVRLNPVGSVLMAMYGATIGKLGILEVPMTTNQACCACIPFDGMLNTYLFYFLMGNRLNFIKMGEGGAQPNISKEKIVNFPIAIPPLAEQKRIVAKLDEILPLIDRYEAAWSKLEEFNKRFPGDMQKSILQLAIQGKLVEQRPEEGTGEELFQQIQTEKQALIKAGKIKKEEALPEIADIEIPFDIPDTWHWVRLGDCSTYTQRKEKVSPSDITSDMWSLDLEDIEKGTGRIVQYCKASERKIAGDKVKFYTGQVLYSKLRPYLKKVLVAPADGICTGEIVPFSVYGNIEPQYIVYVLTCPHVDYVINSVTYGVKMPRVGTQTMAELLIPLPPLAEQKRIVAKLEEILPLCDRLK